MPDIWGNIGLDIPSSGSSEGEWLYKVGGEVRGPMPLAAVADKLVKGEITLDTPVAKEGGDFHPIARVAAFSSFAGEAKKQAQKRSAAKVRKIILLAALPVLAALGGGGYYVFREFQASKAQKEAEARRVTAELEQKRKKEEAVPDIGLVALVSLGTEDEVKIKKHETGTPSTKKTTKSKQETREEPEQMVAQCNLSQADIFGTLKRHLAKINVCVEAEKEQDKEGLLPSTLSLSFVVQTSGKVTDFEIEDRHYRKGPMNNCMIKAFNTISFPSSTGANCPVSIPIKIGK